MVICLSHGLVQKDKDGRFSEGDDVLLAKAVPGLDVVVGNDGSLCRPVGRFPRAAHLHPMSARIIHLRLVINRPGLSRPQGA